MKKQKWRIGHRILALSVLLIAFSGFEPDSCTDTSGGCTFGATYNEELDMTFWGVTCNDGFTSSGGLHGNQVADLCGPE